MSEEFYLCQPPELMGSVPSCASCCGVYNYTGHDRGMITGLLALQTRLMEGFDGTEAEAERIAREVEAARPTVRFDVIYNCPYVGFLDKNQTRIGCLLHPLRLGRDLREFCRYGHRTCAEARCTAYTYLSDAEAQAVMAAAGDWYLYGLCITDLDLVKDFFELCEMKLYRPVDPGRVARSAPLADRFHDYLALKENWPWAADPGRFGKYYFVGRDYHVYLINYPKLGLAFPHHDGILQALGSVIETPAELLAAVKIIDDKVEAFLEAYAQQPRRRFAAGGVGL